MTLFGLTLFGRDILSIRTEAKPPAPPAPDLFSGFEYKCFHCGEMLLRRETPLTDKDLTDLCELHVCED